MPTSAMEIVVDRRSIQLSDAECKFFDEQGYFRAEGVLEGGNLVRVQEEFCRVEAATQEDWQRQVEGKPDYNAYGIGEKAHVVYPIAPYGDVFVDLLEYPATMSIVEAFMGPDVQMADNALHVKPAGTRAHTDWHRDSLAWFHIEADAWNDEDRRAWARMRVCETPFLKIKVFFFVDDVDEETSPFTVVPGSHKVDVDRVPKYDPLEDMPNHVRLVGKAGDAILWNGCIWHTSMDNTDTKARRMLLYNYTHFGMKQHPPCIPRGKFVDYVKQRSPLCRQLFGLERMARG